MLPLTEFCIELSAFLLTSVGFLHNRAIDASNKSAINPSRFHRTSQSSPSRHPVHPQIILQDGKAPLIPMFCAIVLVPESPHTSDTATNTNDSELKIPGRPENGLE